MNFRNCWFIIFISIFEKYSFLFKSYTQIIGKELKTISKPKINDRHSIKVAHLICPADTFKKFREYGVTQISNLKTEISESHRKYFNSPERKQCSSENYNPREKYNTPTRINEKLILTIQNNLMIPRSINVNLIDMVTKTVINKIKNDD